MALDFNILKISRIMLGVGICAICVIKVGVNENESNFLEN